MPKRARRTRERRGYRPAPLAPAVHPATGHRRYSPPAVCAIGRSSLSPFPAGTQCAPRVFGLRPHPLRAPSAAAPGLGACREGLRLRSSRARLGIGGTGATRALRAAGLRPAPAEGGSAPLGHPARASERASLERLQDIRTELRSRRNPRFSTRQGTRTGIAPAEVLSSARPPRALVRRAAGGRAYPPAAAHAVKPAARAPPLRSGLR